VARGTGASVIAITFDVDWAPDAVIEDVLGLLDKAGVRATFFATHGSAVLRALRGHEIAIHPNFAGVKDHQRHLDELMSTYPDARGVRCHSYHQSTRILDLFVDRGLLYDSNILMFRVPGIHAFRNWNGLARIPVFWEDDVNCMVGGGWDPAQLDLADPGALFVFDFHPIHVFLNTEGSARYEAAKPHLKEPAKLAKMANPESSGVGVRVFLKRLLALLGQRELPVKLLRDIAAGVSSVGPAARPSRRACGGDEKPPPGRPSGVETTRR
jgi:hypothetical protein